MNKRGGFWDFLAWIVLGLILLWLVLKTTGVINTPDLITYAPYFGAVYLAGWAMKKLDTAVDEIKDLKKFKEDTIKEINKMRTVCVKNHPK